MTANLRSGGELVPDRIAQNQNSRESDADQDRAADAGPSTVECDDLLALFGDEYACKIIRALSAGPMAARNLLNRFDMSRPTVYRRLDRLTDVGIVDSEMILDKDGYHRQEYRLLFNNVEFRINDDGTAGAVEVCGINNG